jgi:hypothetical protein
MLGELNAVMATPTMVEEFDRIPIGNAEEMMEFFCEWLSTANSKTAREEFGVLPRSFLIVAQAAWSEALDGGKPFRLESEAPEKRIEAARNGRVAWNVSYDEEGVKMVVSHVHGHHAEWFARPELASVT